MAGVGQGITGEEERTGGTETPSSLRIDTDVFAALSETAGEGDEEVPTIVGWFDCWRS